MFDDPAEEAFARLVNFLMGDPKPIGLPCEKHAALVFMHRRVRLIM